MGLSIQTTPAKISIETVNCKIERKSEMARLELKQKPPVVNIKTELPRVLIDQYECFAEEGLKNNYDLLKEQSGYAYRHVMEYIARVAQDGDAMAKIGRKANIMIDIAQRNSVTTHEFGMVTMPMARPKIDYVGGTVEFDPEPINDIGMRNGVIGTYIPPHTEFNYTPGKVYTKMESYGSIEIKYTGNNVDNYI
ncbi:DUF6470 family protein [Ruminiclostridium josui]|uniref:DUF6470 family protein n=1 Tax=Ruminiclostridium josui TaxID=1499 RepID=UPI0004647F70|nr:DUF6470 family protein [Ruminiclostridium josui]